VPFEGFSDSAAVLDNKRLNKQLLEGRQIYNILSSGRTSGAWVNHPAVKMWRNHENSLFQYLLAMRIECDLRGIATQKNWDAITEMHNNNWHRGDTVIHPAWLGDERVHLSHRQNLYKKSPDYYAEFSRDNALAKCSCCDSCNYFWPTHTLIYNYEMSVV
jgi:hypothetical protein